MHMQHPSIHRACVTKPQQTRSSGELPRVATLHAYCPASMLDRSPPRSALGRSLRLNLFPSPAISRDREHNSSVFWESCGWSKLMGLSEPLNSHVVSEVRASWGSCPQALRFA